MHLAKLGREGRRRSHSTYFPACDVEGFAEAGDDEGPLGQAGKAGSTLVHGAIEDHVLVHLIGDQQHIGGRQQLFQRAHVGFGPHGGTGVVRCVDDDETRARRECCGDLAEVGAEAAGGQRYAYDHAASQLDIGHVTVVAGLQHDDLVTGLHASQDGCQDRLGGTGGDGNFTVFAIRASVQCFYFCSKNLAQRRHAGHGWVLVVAGLHGACHGIDQRRVTVEVGETLAQVNGAMLGCQCGHGAEDGGAHLGQAAGEDGCAHSS